jgi:hypothetical protein
MQEVVNSFRDGEEFRLARQHQPPVADPSPQPVRQHALKHLGDTATVCRRVDMPDRPIAQYVPGGLGRCQKPLRPLWAEKSDEQLEGLRLDLDFLHRNPYCQSEASHLGDRRTKGTVQRRANGA